MPIGTLCFHLLCIWFSHWNLIGCDSGRYHFAGKNDYSGVFPRSEPLDCWSFSCNSGGILWHFSDMHASSMLHYFHASAKTYTCLSSEVSLYLHFQFKSMLSPLNIGITCSIVQYSHVVFGKKRDQRPYTLKLREQSQGTTIPIMSLKRKRPKPQPDPAKPLL
jgi:hypothetical protein